MDDYLPKSMKLHALKSLIEQWAPYGKDQRADQPMVSPSDTATPFAVTPVAAPAPRTDRAVPAARQVDPVGDGGDTLDLEQLDTIRALQEPGAPDVVAMVIDEFRIESRELGNLAHGSRR